MLFKSLVAVMLVVILYSVTVCNSDGSTSSKYGNTVSKEAFMTEFEKTRALDDRRKQNRALTTIGVLAAIVGGIVGARYLAGRSSQDNNSNSTSSSIIYGH